MVARFGYFLCPCKFTAMNTVNNTSNSSLEVVIKPTMSKPKFNCTTEGNFLSPVLTVPV